MSEPTSHPRPAHEPERDGAGSALSLHTYLQIVRRQRRLVVLVALLTTLAAMVPGLLAAERYSSTSSVRVSALDQEGVFRTDPNPGNPTTDRVIDLVTEIEIIKSAPMRRQVVDRLPSTLEFSGPNVSQVGFSQVVAITVTASEPEVAARVATAYAEVFVEDRRERSTDALLNKAEELRDQSRAAAEQFDEVAAQLLAEDLPAAEETSLQLSANRLAGQVGEFGRRADELEIEAALRGTGTQVVEPGTVNRTPTGSGPARGALLGLTLGVLLGLAAAVVIDTIQDRLADRGDLAGLRPSIPVLATVPHATVGRNGLEPSFAVVEAFRYLATSLRFHGLDAPLRSLIVTSAVGEEGKTTTAVNLALAMAETGDRVVLVDCDLRRPSVHHQFGLPNDVGLSSVVEGRARLDEVTHFVQDGLAVLTSGPGVANPTELLGSAACASVLQAVIDQSDVTIIDSPPVLPVADARIAGRHTDGALVVARVGQVRRRALRDLLDRLDEAMLPVVGFVANDAREEGSYGYYRLDDHAGLPGRWLRRWRGVGGSGAPVVDGADRSAAGAAR